MNGTPKNTAAERRDNVRYPDYLLQIKQPLFTLIRNAEFKALIADYLKTLKPGYPRTLDELIARPATQGPATAAPKSSSA